MISESAHGLLQVRCYQRTWARVAHCFLRCHAACPICWTGDCSPTLPNPPVGVAVPTATVLGLFPSFSMYYGLRRAYEIPRRQGLLEAVLYSRRPPWTRVPGQRHSPCHDGRP